MDIAKQKLKNRLNVKFEPLKNHRYSVKKIETIRNQQNKQKSKPKFQEEESILLKNRSVSHIKLPSLDKKNNQQNRKREHLSRYQKSELSQHSIILPNSNLVIRSQRQLPKRMSSHKNIPTVKIDAREPINNTITFLLKNQILTVPKIVALLKKTQSDQFLYLKVIGMYQYEVCQEQNKGKQYVTVSKNGMVINGQLITLENLVHQFEIYKKLQKIHFYKYYTLIKYMGKWQAGSRKAKFNQHRKNINKIMSLDDQRFFDWKIQIKQLLLSNYRSGGWMNNTWVQSFVEGFVHENKNKIMARFLQICFQLLEEFDLPISSSPELMNRVLGNLSSLNMTFEKKIRIEKEITKFYKLARQVQMIFIQAVGYFVIEHLSNLIKKVQTSHKSYMTVVLTNLQELPLDDENYISKRQKILVNSVVALDIDFTLYYDPVENYLNIRPSPLDLYYENMHQVRKFISKAQQIGFDLVITTQQFQFVRKIIFKGAEPIYYAGQSQKAHKFRNYTLGIPSYQKLTKQLLSEYQAVAQIFNDRLKLLKPFEQLYKQFLGEPPTLTEPYHEDIKAQQQIIDNAYKFLDKLHEGEYFMFGFLNIQQFKDQTQRNIKQYEDKFHKSIPKMLALNYRQLDKELLKHLDVFLENQEDTPKAFIIISEETEALEEIVPDYSAKLQQMERIQQFYTNISYANQSKPARQKQDKGTIQNQQPGMHKQKRLLQELKSRVRQFNSKKDDNFIKYRKILEKNKISIKEKQAFYAKQENKEHQLFQPCLYKPSVSNIVQTTIQRHTRSFFSSVSDSPSKMQISAVEPGQKQYNEYQLEHCRMNNKKVKQYLKTLKSIEKQSKQLNDFQNYFTMKITTLSLLPSYIYLYQNLQEIWNIYLQILQLFHDIQYKSIKDITNHKDVIKKYEGYHIRIEKLQKQSHATDYEELLSYLEIKITQLLSNYEFIAEINMEHLRSSDLQEINYCLERGLQTILKEKEREIARENSRKKMSESSISSGQINSINRNLYKGIKSRDLNYKMIQQYNLKQFKINISEISFKARKEIQIEQIITQFELWFKGIRLEHEPLQNYPYIPIFTQNYKIRTEIEDYTTTILNTLNNKYSSLYRKKCTEILNKINKLVEMLEITIQHQDKFLALFPILTSKYAENQLSTENKKFTSLLNKTMKNIRLLIKPTENLNESLKSILINHIKAFDLSKRTIQKFLEKKRLKFQRFYFLQDDELMEVLVGIGGERQIFRMFDGIRGWLYDKEGVKIGVQGFGGESFILKGWTYRSNIEPQIIFKSLEDSIKNNLNSLVRNVMYSYEFQMKELKELYEIHTVPWMCRYAIELILYTKQIQLNCFMDSVDFKAIQNILRQSIGKVSTSLKQASKTDQSLPQSSLASKQSQNANQITLLLFLLHFTEDLHKTQTTSIFDFQWQSFLRYYFDNSVKMRALKSEHQWGGQYQGLWSLMVNTSDLRRAHACILINLKYGNGVLLQGPSGTGKTQSLKELARCMGKYCVVFNCSSNVKIKTLQKILSGLCYTASWLCLDQINRLSIDIMSVIANQIISIKNAVAAQKQVFNFCGKQIKLYPGVGIFSTMNPIYLKRAKLTENIKSYFRTITVTIPDYQKILEVMLFSLDFTEPYILSKKIGNFFKNLSIQLGEFQQYDFGLRAMKFFVSSMSQYKQKIKSQEQLARATDTMIETHVSEQQIIKKGLYETFAFRIHTSDIERFEKIILDSFKVKLEVNLSKKMSDKVMMMRNSPHTGLIVFGPLSSKTTVINQYCKSYENPYRLDFNTNAVNIKYFMGESVHGRWQPGIVQKVARQSLININKQHILILDATIKSQIIESFNTLLDQSRILSLSSGTRLKIQQNLKMVMETPHLHLASPATITRCNLIYICDTDINKQQLILKQLPKYLQQLPSSLQLKLKKAKNDKKQEQYTKIENILLAEKKLIEFYQPYNFQEIRSIGKLVHLILTEKLINFKQHWGEMEILGIEKAIIFAARILNKAEKIKNLINKDNSFSHKKSPYSFLLAYKKFIEGEFIEINRTFQPFDLHNRIIIRTSETQFCQWINKRALSKPFSGVYWRGPRSSGKSAAIQFSLSSQRNKTNGSSQQSKHIKISITQHINSDSFVKCFSTRLYDKNSNIEESTNLTTDNKLILFIQDLYLGKQQVIEQMRYFIQRKKIFWTQNKQITPLPMFTIYTSGRPEYQTPEYKRLLRHFTELQAPKVQQFVMKTVYSKLIHSYIGQTKTSPALKDTLEIETQRFSTFINDYFERNTESLKEHSIEIGDFYLVPILSKILLLNEENAKQTNDFIALMFNQMALKSLFNNQILSRLQDNKQSFNDLMLSYFKVYKQKYQKEFQKYIKTFNIHSTAPQDRQVYTKMFSTNSINGSMKIHKISEIRKHIASILKAKNSQMNHLHLSDYLLDQIIMVATVILQDQDISGCLMIGEGGYGKHSIIKSAIKIIPNCQYSQFKYPKHLHDSHPFSKQRKQILQKYMFTCLKNSMQKKQITSIIIQMSPIPSHISHTYEVLNFLNLLLSGHPATELFNNDETDYMYASMLDYLDIAYEKSSKSYEQVCDDYVLYSIKRLKCFIIVDANDTEISGSRVYLMDKLQRFPAVFKRIITHTLQEYPSEAIYTVSQSIIIENFATQLQGNKQKANMVSELASMLMKIYKILHSYYTKNLKMSQNSHFFYNHVRHFRLIEKYCTLYNHSSKRIKSQEDILGRAIDKMHETTNISESIQKQLQSLGPSIKTYKNNLIEIVPILQTLKAQYEKSKVQEKQYDKDIQYQSEQADIIRKDIQTRKQNLKKMIDDAIQGLQTIRKNDLQEFKTILNKHPLIKFTSENLALMLGQKPQLQEINKLFSDTNSLLGRVKGLNQNSMSEQIYQELYRRLKEENIAKQWTFEGVSKVAYNIRYIAKYILAMIDGQAIKKQISKKQAQFNKINDILMKNQQIGQKSLQSIKTQYKQIYRLQQQYKQAKKKLQSDEQTESKLKQRLFTAKTILNQLSQTTISKWRQKLEYYKEIRKNKQFYNLLLLLYLQVFINIDLESEQKAIISTISQIIVSDYGKNKSRRQLENQIMADIKQQYLRIEDLNNLGSQNSHDLYDQKKIQFMYHKQNRPMLLDPDNQVVKWLESMHDPAKNPDHKLQFAKQNFNGAAKTAEMAMKEGATLVIFIENGAIDQFTKQILQVIPEDKEGSSNSNKYNSLSNSTNQSNRLVQYNKTMFYIEPKFNLILVCKTRNPKIPPISALSHCIINFQITEQALKDTLLRESLRQQNQLLYFSKISYDAEVRKIQTQVREMQKKILLSLVNTNAKKSIVDDQQLIKIVTQTQNKIQYLKTFKEQNKEEIVVKQQKHMRTFDKVCDQASRIYLSIKTMSKINPLLISNVEIFSKYFSNACRLSITQNLLEEEEDGSEFQQMDNESFINDHNFEFDNYQYGQSRPTSALSMISVVTSRVSGGHEQALEQPNQPTQNMQAQVTPVAATTTTAAILQSSKQYSALNEDMLGTVDTLRYSKIISEFLQQLKMAFNDEERKMWAMILALGGDNRKQDIKMLLGLYNRYLQDSHRQQLRELIEGNIVTEDIKQYFSGCKSDNKSEYSNNVQAMASKLLADKNLLNKFTDAKKIPEQKNALGLIDILIISLIVQPKKFIIFIQQLIRNKGYATVLQSAQLNISSILKNSDHIHPIMLVMGEDPLPRITEYFSRQRFKNAIIISMGDGQQYIAQSILEREYKKQTIVVIHNLHISTAFFGFLAKTVQQFTHNTSTLNRQPHKNFRLILITSPIQQLPFQLTSSCQKYLVESPKSLKNHMLHLYNSVLPKYIPLSNKNNPVPIIQRKLYYSLCLLHCFITQIQKYGGNGNSNGAGWNLKYNYTLQDFIYSIKVIRELRIDENKVLNRMEQNDGQIDRQNQKEIMKNLKQYECNIQTDWLRRLVKTGVDYKAINYMVGQINYLGKMADQLDRKKMQVFLDRHFSEDFLYNINSSSMIRIPQTQNQAYIQISNLQANNPLFFNLHQNTQKVEETVDYYIKLLEQIYDGKNQNVDKQLKNIINQNQNKKIKKYVKPSIIPQINHKLQFINSEISQFNARLTENQRNPSSSALSLLSLQHQYLSKITATSKSFNLLAFQAPRKILSSLTMEMAIKNNVQYEAIKIHWALTMPNAKNENVYAMEGIKLEGASVSNGLIVNGQHEEELTLYFWTQPIKKAKQINSNNNNPVNSNQVQSTKYRVSLPLYLNKERSGTISSFGENTNLLGMVTLDSRQSQQFWTLRGTAFIGNPQ